MSDLNKVILIGRLTRDPESKQVGSTSLATFSIANSYKFSSNGEKKEKTSFFDCKVWGKLAEVVTRYCQKGKQVCITGRLEMESWDSNDGTKRSKLVVVVEELQMLGGNDAKPSQQAPKSYEDMGTEVDDDPLF